MEKDRARDSGVHYPRCPLSRRGWTSRSYLVNDEIVFRVPKRAADWKELEREIAFLSYASSGLPLAVPQYLYLDPNSPAAENGYAVYRYLRGQPLELSALTPVKRANAADLVATFLRALHGLHPNSELGSLLPWEDPRRLAENYLVDAEREIVPKLSQSQATVLRHLFDDYLSRS